jgi:hypothetical protein
MQIIAVSASKSSFLLTFLAWRKHQQNEGFARERNGSSSGAITNI